MTTQYTTILKLALPVQGELSGTWGDVVNDNITQMVEQAIAGKATVNSWTGNSHTLTTADGTTAESRCAILELTDTGTALSGAGTVVCPTNTKLYIVDNNTAQIITVKTSGGTGVAVPVGKTMLVYCDGTNVVEGVTHANSLSLGTSTSTVNAIDTATDLGAGSSSNSNLPTQLAVKTYVDGQIAATNELSEVLAAGNVTGANDIDVENAQKVQFRDSAIYINSSADGQLDLVADTEIQIAATTVDLNGNLDVSGTTVSAGKITADAGIDIDNINIDGTTIALSSGDLTLDVAGDIILDPDGGDVFLRDAGSEFGRFQGSSQDFLIRNDTQDKDISIVGNDGGSTITALAFDMSEAGAATFNSTIAATSATFTTADNNPQLTLISTDADASVGPILKLYRNSASPADNDAVGRLLFTGEDDAGNEATYARIETIATDVTNGSENAKMEFYVAINDTFNPSLTLEDTGAATFTGNVGIGRTPVNTLNPSLELVDGGSIFGFGDTLYLTANLYYASGWKAMATGAGASHVIDSAHKFYTNASVSAGATATPEERVRITSDGKVGIGESNPQRALVVAASDSAGVQTQYVNTTTGSGLGDGFTVGINASEFAEFWNAENTAMLFATNNTERMRIDSDGQILSTANEPTVTLKCSDTSLGADQYIGGFKFEKTDGSGAGTGVVGGMRMRSEGGVGESTYLQFSTSSSSANDAERMRIDSSGNLALMTDGAEFKLYYTESRKFISNSGASVTIKQIDNDAASAFIDFAAWDNSSLMRLMNSGSLLVGTTDTTPGIGDTGAGVSMSAANGLIVSRSGEAPLNLNRNTDDGDLILFRRDGAGTTVGSIGSVSGTDIELNSTLSGSLSAGGTKRFGWNTSGVFFPHTDNANDLGASGSRFKDLYLSGGVVFGDAGGSGTSTSNSLDSYEEGTWTPAFGAETSNPTIGYNQQVGTYTKVGRLVSVIGYIITTSRSGGSGTLTIDGLPFTASSTVPLGSITIGFNYNWNTPPLNGGVQGITNHIILYQDGRTNATSTPADIVASGNSYFYFSCTYYV